MKNEINKRDACVLDIEDYETEQERLITFKEQINSEYDEKE